MSQPYPIFGTQDLADDDALVIDDLVKPSSEPADIKGAIEPVTIPETVKPKPATRIQAVTVLLSAGAPPYQLFNPDDKRINSHVQCHSTASPVTFNDYVIVSDQSGNISSGSNGIAVTLRDGKTADFDGHTGALWVIPGAVTQSIEVTGWAVTEL